MELSSRGGEETQAIKAEELPQKQSQFIAADAPTTSRELLPLSDDTVQKNISALSSSSTAAPSGQSTPASSPTVQPQQAGSTPAPGPRLREEDYIQGDYDDEEDAIEDEEEDDEEEEEDQPEGVPSCVNGETVRAANSRALSSKRSCVNAKVRWLMFESIRPKLRTQEELVAAQWVLGHCYKQLPYDRNWWSRTERQVGELSMSNVDVERQIEVLNTTLYAFVRQIVSATDAVRKYINGIDPVTNSLRKRDWNASTSLSEWISGERGLLIKKLASNDPDVRHVRHYLPDCLCEANLRQALHHGGILIYSELFPSARVKRPCPPQPALSTEAAMLGAKLIVGQSNQAQSGPQLNLVRPGAADTRMLDITLMDGSVMPVRRSRCSLGIPAAFVSDPVVIPKICVYDFSNGIHLYIFYRGHKMGRRKRARFGVVTELPPPEVQSEIRQRERNNNSFLRLLSPEEPKIGGGVSDELLLKALIGGDTKSDGLRDQLLRAYLKTLTSSPPLVARQRNKREPPAATVMQGRFPVELKLLDFFGRTFKLTAVLAVEVVPKEEPPSCGTFPGVVVKRHERQNEQTPSKSCSHLMLQLQQDITRKEDVQSPSMRINSTTPSEEPLDVPLRDEAPPPPVPTPESVPKLSFTPAATTVGLPIDRLVPFSHVNALMRLTESRPAADGPAAGPAGVAEYYNNLLSLACGEGKPQQLLRNCESCGREVPIARVSAQLLELKLTTEI